MAMLQSPPGISTSTAPQDCSPGKAVASRVSEMIVQSFSNCIDAELRIELALYEVATDNVHRDNLENAVDDPQSFNHYARQMVFKMMRAFGDDEADQSSKKDSLSLEGSIRQQRMAPGVTDAVGQTGFTIAEAVLAEDEHDTTFDDESSCPCTPTQRDRARQHISRRLDEHSRLNDSIGSDLSGSWRSTLASLLNEEAAEQEEPVDRTTPMEVRKAYLQLAKHYHPDKGGDQEMFVTLQSAYEILRTDGQESSP